MAEAERMPKMARLKKCQGGHPTGRGLNALLCLLVHCDGDDSNPLPPSCVGAKSVERETRRLRACSANTAACTAISEEIHHVRCVSTQRVVSYRGPLNAAARLTGGT